MTAALPILRLTASFAPLPNRLPVFWTLRVSCNSSVEQGVSHRDRYDVLVLCWSDRWCRITGRAYWQITERTTNRVTTHHCCTSIYIYTPGARFSGMWSPVICEHSCLYLFQDFFISSVFDASVSRVVASPTLGAAGGRRTCSKHFRECNAASDAYQHQRVGLFELNWGLCAPFQTQYVGPKGFVRAEYQEAGGAIVAERYHVRTKLCA